MTMRAATLSRVIHTAADRRASATDRELLRRFAAGNQDAFEVLVRRHTGLVLNVCRRALPNAEDAEDACQAVFVILARKAASGRWQPSIANWLFATARRVARDLRRAADRRAKREGRAAVPESVVPVDQMTGRELLATIDEELDRLPPIYREPLLLYYQAELARDELGAVLLGLGLNSMPPTSAGQPPAPKAAGSDKAEAAKVVDPAASGEKVFAGRVLGPDGKAVAGAKLYALYYTPKVLPVPQRATSDK